MAIQLQDFAKQVLFGTTMEEKLGFPREEIIDTKPGDAIRTPRTLTRPAHLTLREDGVRAEHPSQAKLVNERDRGRLLHFFGNHELLATELMALVLLKFPNAPASFRRGVLETLKEEQIHTQLYIHRMEQCGVTFGELPLSDYFWKSVSSMEDPLDYVTRLSLTFEQANLDYSREYGKVFEQVGDPSTAKILDKIYHDEIDHVGFGLKWFRRWKAAGRTDWEAFRERLVFPLSPARAKGNDFNAAGRAEAGLDADFISGLQVFQQSRGRTPSVFWFNPDAEQFAAKNTPGETAPVAATVQHDLAFLPAFLSRQDDVLLMPSLPSAEFLLHLQRAGFQLPEIIAYEASPQGSKAPDLDRKINRLRPWAWTPDAVAFFEKTFASLTRPLAPENLWNASTRALFSKAWSADWGRQLAERPDAAAWMAPPEVYGQPVSSLEALSALRTRWTETGYPDLVCKAPFSTAANGLRLLRSGEAISSAMQDWLETIWATQGAVIVEPWLERLYDFSVQMDHSAEGTRTLAFTRLINNARGQFKGIVTNAGCKGLAPELARFIMERVQGRPRLYQWYTEDAAPFLREALRESTFTGPLGMDALIYRDPRGELRLKPVVEINPRFTMGRVAHELGQHNAQSAVGYFQILTRAQLRKTETPEFRGYVDAMKAQFPIKMSEEAQPRIRRGSLPLNDPTSAQQFLAVYHVRENIDQLELRQ